jgi:hypothetical protein
MDIFIVHDGHESGPHSEKATRQLLDQGEVAASDFAWREGLPKWLPLSELLETPILPASSAPPAPEATTQVEPATAKQKALLNYLAIAFRPDLTRDQASRLVNDAMEDGKNSERLSLWNEERLRLHPELFGAEAQAKKENRANHFFELCQAQGAEYFSGISKAHCQVLVGFLDVKFPHWDARAADAAEHYFFPAVAEKFPQLVQKQWRGRLHYPSEGMKVSSDIVRKSPTSKLQTTGTSALVAVARGLALGGLILGVLYLGYQTMHQDVNAASVQGNTPATEKAAVAATPAPEIPATVSNLPQNLPPIEAVAPVAEVVPAPPAPTPHPAPVATTPIPPPPPPSVLVAVVPEPAMSPAPSVDPSPTMGAIPPPPPPAAALPAAPAVDPGATMSPSGVPGLPTMTAPAGEPPVPVIPPPATLPAPAVLPSNPVEPGLTPPPVAVMPTPPGFTEPPHTTSAAKTGIVLTKPVEIQLAYGKIVLPIGTPVKLVSRQGQALKVSYQNSVIMIPVTSTDLE